MSSYTLRLILLAGGLFCFCTSSLWGQNKNAPDSTVQVQSNGDTIITYSVSAYDYGKLKTATPLKGAKKSSDARALRMGGGQEGESLRTTPTRYVGETLAPSVWTPSIPYTSGQTATGGLSYSIPITLGPLVQLAPTLSLVYNSQAGDGVAGYGWSLAGLSSILPTNKTIHFDGGAGSPTWSPSPLSWEAISLDGVRFVPNVDHVLQGYYPMITEQGNILGRVRENGYEVRYPNGTVGIYELNTSTPRRYGAPLSRLTDHLGNSVTFAYDRVAGIDYIQKIVLHRIDGGRGGEQAERVEFFYEDRKAFTEGYAYGEPVAQKKLLKRIIVYSGGEELMTYELQHEWKQGRYYVRQIGCSSHGNKLNPIRLRYQYDKEQGEESTLTAGASVHLAATLDIDREKQIIQRGRLMRGEGNDGLIIYPKKDTYGIVRTLRRKFLGSIISETHEYGGLYPEGQSILIAPSLSEYTGVNKLIAGKGFQELRAVDIDGDGLDELVKLNLNGVACYPTKGVPIFIPDYRTKLQITVYHPEANWNKTCSEAKTFEVTIPGCVSNSDFISPQHLYFYWGAFLGDGRAQLLIASPHKNAAKVEQSSTFTLVDLEEQKILSQHKLFDVDDVDVPNIHIIDVDGDGRSDLCRAKDGRLICYSMGRSDKTFQQLSGWGRDGQDQFPNSSSLHWCDLNGDGLMDAFVPVKYSHWEWEDNPDPNNAEYERGWFVFHDEGSNWHFYINTGRGFKSYEQSLFPLGADPNKEGDWGGPDEIFAIDVNHDGLSDLVYIDDEGISVYLNEHGLISSPRSAFLPTGFIRPIPLSLVTRDQTAQLLCMKTDGACIPYILGSNQQRRGLLTNFIDSRGIEQCNQYVNLRGISRINHGAPYTETATVGPQITEGLCRILPSWYLLQGQRTYLPDETGTIIADKLYYYTNLMVSRLGLGFCGFEQTRVEDLQTFTEQVTRYAPTLRGVPVSVTTGLLGQSASHPAEEAHMEYAQGVYPTRGKRWGYHLSAVRTKNHLMGTSQEKTLTYDPYQYVTKERLVSSLLDGSSSRTQAAYNTYRHSLSPSLYLLGTQSQTRTELTIGTQPRTATTVTMEHDALLRPVSSTTTQDNGTSAGVRLKRSVWSYDDRGHLISEKSAPYEVSQLLGDTYTYDGEGHVVAKTDALGLVVRSSDFDQRGNARVKIDALGNRTQTEYDIWGNAVRVQGPDGSIRTTSYEQGSHGQYTEITRSTGAPTTHTVYDALGRVQRQGSELFDGSMLWTDTNYDRQGNIHQVSLPYRGATATSWNEYSYDEYGRKTLYVEASGKETTWQYERNQTTETKEGISKTQTHNEVGQLSSVKDAGGTIYYNYNKFGLIARIRVVGGGYTTFEYDDYGRQTRLDDPSAGLRETEYNYASDGTCTKRYITPNGSITTTTDPYGRLLRIDRDKAFSTSYTYDAYSRPIEERSTNGSFKSYTYDALGRIATQEEGVTPSKILKRTYGYDRDGRVASLTYRTPESEEFTEQYSYAHGHHMMTRLQSPLRPTIDTIWRLLAVNNMGIPTEASTGGQRRTYSYSPQGVLTGRAMGDVQRETYEFDPHTGNLSLRTWMVRDTVRTQSFRYDLLNRLTMWGLSSGNLCAYDSNGNLDHTGDEITGGCNFLYEDGAHPYRLTEVNSYEGKGFHPVKPDPQPDPQPVPFSGNPFIRIKDLIPPSLQTEVEQTLTYTSFDRPESITQGSYRAVWDYNSALDRIRIRLTRGDTLQREVYYWGNQYEEEHRPQSGEQTARLYLEGDAYSAPAVLVKERGGWHLYYIARDYLGSITDIVASDGTRRAHYHYSPWGRVEEGQEEPLFLGRGFTGHEHLPEFDLIQMNARLYDPYTGRFLSPDPYVQLPDFSQSFNRYSYCLNNPLRYTDQSGKVFWLIPVAIGAIIGGTMNAIAHRQQISGFGGFLAYFGVGALVGGLSGFTGGALAASNLALGAFTGAAIGAASGAVTGAVSGIALNGLNNLIAGRDFFLEAGSSALWGAAGGAISGAISGGIRGYKLAEKMGANRWTGAKYMNMEHYGALPKTGIPAQPDPKQYCYAYASEYADKGHFNRKASEFIQLAGEEKGAAISELSPRAFPKDIAQVKSSTFNESHWAGMMQKLSSRRVEYIATIASGENGHAVNIIGMTFADKLNLLGGGSSHILYNINIWDPITGASRTISPSSIICFTEIIFK